MTGTPTPAPDTPQGQQTPAQLTAAAIAAQAQQRNQVASLADALTPPSMTAALVSKATIVSVEWGYPPTVTIQLGGDTSSNIPAVRFLDSFVPTAGDTVIVVKQGSELFVLGQMMDNLSAGSNGWRDVTLTTAWNQNTTLQPALARLIYDNGVRKVQLQGRVWRNTGVGTSTTLFTLPTGFAPATQRAFVVTRENLTGGANDVQLQINTSGTVTISGQQLQGPSAEHGNLTTSYYDVNHFHEQSGGGLFTGTVRYSTGGAPLDGVLGGSAQDGGRSPNHRHTTNSASHSHTPSFPGWVSLDGVEFFL
ncbi:minor tail protein [Rhodococcus phage Jflix2]|nr:minor tail protein [Rhodococcus phage Jflix2]